MWSTLTQQPDELVPIYRRGLSLCVGGGVHHLCSKRPVSAAWNLINLENKQLDKFQPRHNLSPPGGDNKYWTKVIDPKVNDFPPVIYTFKIV